MNMPGIVRALLIMVAILVLASPEAKADAARGQGWPNSGAHNVTASVQTNHQRIQTHPAFRLSPPNLPRLNMRCGRS